MFYGAFFGEHWTKAAVSKLYWALESAEDFKEVLLPRYNPRHTTRAVARESAVLTGRPGDSDDPMSLGTIRR